MPRLALILVLVAFGHLQGASTLPTLPVSIDHWPAIQGLDAFNHEILRFVQINRRIYFVNRNDHVFVIGEDVKSKATGKYLTHLGLGEAKHLVNEPTEVVQLRGKKIVKFCQGHEHTLALGDDGRVYSWGWNDYGQLGFGDTKPQFTPFMVEHIKDADDVACGYASSYAVDNNGDVYAWGANTYGQLGSETKAKQVSTPVKLNITSVSQLETYGEVDYVLAVTSKGQVFGWGEGSEEKSKPAVITSNQELVAHSLTATNNFGFILDHEGQVYIKEVKTAKARLFYEGVNRFRTIYGHKGYNDTLVGETIQGDVYVWWNASLGGAQIEKLTEIHNVADAFALTGLPQFSPMLTLTYSSLSCDHSQMMMDKLFNNAAISDFRFIIDQKTIHVHREILELSSGHMRNQLLTSWKSLDQVTVLNYSYDVYYRYLHYLYTDRLDVTIDQALELNKLAVDLQEAKLKQRCQEVINV